MSWHISSRAHLSLQFYVVWYLFCSWIIWWWLFATVEWWKIIVWDLLWQCVVLPVRTLLLLSAFSRRALAVCFIFLSIVVIYFMSFERNKQASLQKISSLLHRALECREEPRLQHLTLLLYSWKMVFYVCLAAKIPRFLTQRAPDPHKTKYTHKKR